MLTSHKKIFKSNIIEIKESRKKSLVKNYKQGKHLSQNKAIFLIINGGKRKLEF